MDQLDKDDDANPTSEDVSDTGDESDVDNWLMFETDRDDRDEVMPVQLLYRTMCKIMNFHRFEEATKMLDLLLMEPKVLPEFVFTTGFSIFKHMYLEYTESGDFVKRKAVDEFTLTFINRMLSSPTNQPFVMLEYMMFLITHERYEDAKTFVGNNRRFIDQAAVYPRSPVVSDLLDLYIGYLDYIDWEKELDANGDTDFARRKAESAILLFSHIIAKKAGQFDLFVVKSMRILKYYDRNEETKEILYNYEKRNPNNLNSQVYLCKYLMTDKSSDESEINKYLSKVAQLSPSDELVLIYAERLMESELAMSAILLMNYVDYIDRKSDVSGWELLANCLLMSKRNADAMLTIKARYSDALQTYWTKYHFTNAHCESDSHTLLYYKAYVIAYFESSTFSFVDRVSHTISQGEKLKQTIEEEDKFDKY